MKRWPLPAVCALLAACHPDLPELPRQMIPEPPASDVESVVFLIGDAGNAIESRSPVLWRLRGDVEAWSRQLQADSSVVVLFLGDNVYPDGLDRPDEPAYERDSTVLQSQVNAVAGPAARQRAWAYFMAGNHDWGDHRSGDARIKLQGEFLDRRRADGTRVRLLPEAGEPGPALVDIGSRLRLLIYDTAWWLLATDRSRKTRVIRQTEDLLRTSGDRHVLIAAHHPFKSASVHGGNVRLWRTIGVEFLLNRSGALLQDLNSGPYRELQDGMKGAFRLKQPLVYAAGHDHALQVIRHDEPDEPAWTLVSGSGSKMSRIGHTLGMQYRGSAAGYMKLFFRRDGHVELFVVAAPGGQEHLECAVNGDELRACMAEKAAGFETRYGRRLR